MPGRWDAAGFADLISKILNTTGMKNVHLARLAGVHATTVGRWLRGETRPDPDTVRKLMDSLERGHPEADELTARLYDAAGYGLTDPEPMPDIVRDNWRDETVRSIWASGAKRDVRIGMITMYLKDQQQSALSRVPLSLVRNQPQRGPLRRISLGVS
jgi:transcriptional regulator with XRE-family HTH domain